MEMSGVEGNRGGDRVGDSREWQGWAASTSGSDLQHKDCTKQQPGQRGAFHKNGEQQQLRGRVGERRQPAHLLVLHICADAQRCWACTCRDGQGGSLIPCLDDFKPCCILMGAADWVDTAKTDLACHAGKHNPLR